MLTTSNTLKKLFFNKIIYISVFFFQTGLFGALFAQSGSWEVYNSSNTILSDSQVNAILIKDDIKWVGTNWGLYAFDDNTWTNYSAYLPHQQVRSLAFDNNGFLWIGTLDGLVVYDGENWMLYNDSIVNNQINTIAFDNENTAFVGTIDGLYQYNGSWSLLLDTSSFEPFINVTSLKFSNDSLCIGTMNGGFGYYYNGDVSWENTTSGLIDNTVFDFSIDDNNNKWLATPYGGLNVHLLNGSWLSYNTGFYESWPSNSLLSTFFDNTGLLWIGSNEAGIFSFTLEGGIPITTVYNSSNSGLPNNVVYCIQQDDNGIFWLGTQGGLVRWDQSVGVNEFYSKNTFNTIVKNHLNISNVSDISIYNLHGQKLIEKEKTKQINMSGFSPGIYLLQIDNVIHKLIKQ